MTDEFDATRPLLVTYCDDARAAYVYYRPIARGGVHWTCDYLFPTLLDFDRDGNLLGVECLDTRVVPDAWLARAVPPGTPVRAG